MRLRLGFLSAIVLLAGTSIFAQGLTGTLNGNVQQGDTALPGVTVTVASPNLQGERTAVTNDAGGYVFGALPPGDYKVRFELAGMNTVVKSVHVGISQNARLDATMTMGAVNETITVSSTAPTVIERPQVQTNFQQDLIEQLPIPRTLASITGLAPGVVGGVNGSAISGGQSFDNLYTVDGAVVQENLRGQPHTLFIEDAIQETTVHTAGISAEFGNFTGGVVTAITKSGGNELHASVRDSVTNPKWTANSGRPWQVQNGTPVQLQLPQRLDQLRNQYEATLGGRIVRDRLWFFGAGRYFNRESAINFSNSNGVYPRQSTDKRLEGKLTGAITSKHNVVLSIIDAPTTGTNDCQIGCLDSSSLDPSISNPLRSKTAFYNGVLTSNLLLEGQFTNKTFAFVGYGGDDHDRVTGTPVRLTAPGYSTSVNEPFFCGDCRDEDRDNKQYALKASYFLGTHSLGSHTIITGIDRWHETRLADNYQSPSLYVAVLSGFAPTVNADRSVLVNVRGGANGDTMQYFPLLVPSQGSSLNTNSAYINDNWDLSNRWNFNIGFRYDANDSTDSIGNKVANDSKVSPRLGATMDVFGNGRLRLNGSFSTYVGRLAETVAGVGSAAGNPARFNHRYQGPDIKNVTAVEAMRQMWAWFDLQGGIDKTPITSQNIPGATSRIDGSLASPSVNEWTVGASTQFTKGFIRADVIRRDWNDFYTSFVNTQIGQTTLPSGSKADLTLVRNSNAFDRKYNALELQSAYSFTRKFSLGGNYTWSTLRGNYTGETGGGGPGTEGAAESFYPEYFNFPQSDPVGYLVASDQRHKLRGWLSYDIPTPLGAFNVSVLQRFDSGGRYSLAGSIDIRESATFYGTTAGGVKNPGYVTPPTSVTYYFSDRGQFKFDDIMATDLALNYTTNPAWLSGVSLSFQGELVNAMNRKGHTFNTAVLTNLNDATLQKFNPMAGDVPAQGVNWKKGSLFGLPTSATTADSAGSFQTPRTYRFSMVLRY